MTEETNIITEELRSYTPPPYLYWDCAVYRQKYLACHTAVFLSNKKILKQIHPAGTLTWLPGVQEIVSIFILQNNISAKKQPKPDWRTLDFTVTLLEQGQSVHKTSLQLERYGKTV